MHLEIEAKLQRLVGPIRSSHRQSDDQINKGATSEPLCNDNNPCTSDSCNPTTGICQHTGGSGPCDDLDPCTLNDICGPLGCKGTPMNCSDSDPCTPDTCANGSCVPGHPDCESQQDPCNPNPVQNSYSMCNETAITLIAPGFVPVNCDDDNNNQIPDMFDVGPIVEEDDLRPVSVLISPGGPPSTAPPSSWIWRISEGSGNRTWKAYRNPDKTGPVDSTAGYQPWPPPSTLWLEGVAEASDCPSRLVIWIGVEYAGGGACIYCGYENESTSIQSATLDLEFENLTDAKELDPGALLCLNNDDDNGNGIPDKDETGVVTGENDLVPLTISMDGQAGTLTLQGNAAAQSKLRLFQGADRSGLITNWQWTSLQLPTTVYVEGQMKSDSVRDIELSTSFSGSGSPCADRIRLTVIKAEMDPITSGELPEPMNPAIIAPMAPLLLDNQTNWWDANTFGLTRLEPDIDLSPFPIYWGFMVTDGLMTPQTIIQLAANKRSATVRIPFPSWGNLGEGRMDFLVNNHICASVTTLIKNVKSDLEPGHFIFDVKAHLCTDGAGTSTTRTVTEVKAIMSDVTKVLSQCGIIVTTSSVVTTTVNPAYMNLDTTALFSMWFLFGTDEDASDIDVYFIKSIDFDAEYNCGASTGVTGTPKMSGIAYEAGIAIPDSSCDGPATGQEVVRTLAHEIAHYLLNHEGSDVDHSLEPRNLMAPASDHSKRDLDQIQCLEMRENNESD